MNFITDQLRALMQLTDREWAAERANLCLEERVTLERQAAYEVRVGRSADWSDWEDAHRRYVVEDVRRRHPLSAAFDGGDALRPNLEPNQELYRVERIDGVLRDFGGATGETVDVERVGRWITARDGQRARSSRAGAIVPGNATLETLTQFLNEEFADGRPRFVALAAEFPDLERQPDWPVTISERCGLAHHCVGTPVTLALFRYRIEDVLAACRGAGIDATVFAVPTVLDVPMSNAFFTAPKSLHVGHAVGLAPRSDCAHLAAELVHARMDYRAEHWVAVATLERDTPSPGEMDGLRVTHLDCLRRTPGNEEYGFGCFD